MRHTMTMPEMQSCIQACLQCFKDCEYCGTQCIGMLEMADCAKTCFDCAEECECIAQMMA